MARKLITGYTLFAFLICFVGCTSTVNLPKEELAGPKAQDHRIAWVETQHGDTLKFLRSNGMFDASTQMVSGTAKADSFVSIELDRITLLGEERHSEGKTALLVAGLIGVGLIVKVIAVLKSLDDVQYSGGFGGH
jgi:hypothetical protein